MINYRCARPVCRVSTQRCQTQLLYIGQLDLHTQKGAIYRRHTVGHNEEVVDRSSLFYALSEAKERGVAAHWEIGTWCLIDDCHQARGNGHKVTILTSSSVHLTPHYSSQAFRILQLILLRRTECFPDLGRNKKRNVCSIYMLLVLQPGM